jgi:hypothetical protein
VKNFAVIYVCDLDQVPDFKQMYGEWPSVIVLLSWPSGIFFSRLALISFS